MKTEIIRRLMAAVFTIAGVILWHASLGSNDLALAAPPAVEPQADTVQCDWCCKSGGNKNDCSCTVAGKSCPSTPPKGTPCGNTSVCQGSCTKGECPKD